MEKLQIRLGKKYRTELWGVSEALGVALRITAPRKPYKVTVFSNSETAIRKIQGSKTGAGQALKAQIVKRAKQLQSKGSEVTIRWVPSHSKIEGNEQADKAAKEAATGGKIWDRTVELPSIH